MDNQFFIRIRGRVLGPYDQERLQSLAKRGQLSRLHELSEDATNWFPAKNRPELFAVEERSVVAVGHQVVSETRDSIQRQGQPTAMPGRRWWYRKNGSETGPIDETTLQQTLASGNLGPDDIIWAEGMPQWLPARQVPGLLPTQATPWPQQTGGSSAVGTGDGKGELSASVCKSALASRPWVTFIAIVLFVHAGLAIVAGIFALVVGAKGQQPAMVAWGLFSLLGGVDYAAGGLILSSYATRVGSLRYSAHPVVLEKVLDTLRTFWIFVSLNLIVLLAFLVFGSVWAFAIGISLPGF
jgi:hypothetical protein